MNKAIISVSVVLGLVCSTVIVTAAAQRGEKAQRFLFDRTDTDGDGFISGEGFTCTLLSVSPSVTASVTASVTPSVTASVTPSISVSPSVTPSVTASVTASISVSPSVTAW